MVDPLQPAHAVRCLKAAGARSVWLVHRPGEVPRTVKGWPMTPSLALKWVLGQSQPQRHVRLARRLAGAGVATPRVAGGPRWVRRHGSVLLELELEHVPGRTALEVLRAGDPLAVRHAAEAVATMLRRLIAARLFNRDLKLSNIVVAAAPGGWEAWLLDPVGVRTMGDVRGQTARMLERLEVEAREQRLVVASDVRRLLVDAAVGALQGG